jgi:DNA-binding CsgD family transcriptional regulator
MPKAPSQDNAEQVAALIGTIYDAALDPALWPDALGKACRFLDCRYGAIAAMDILRSEVNFVVPWGYPAEAWQSYLDTYFNQNPFNPVTWRSSTGDVACRANLPTEWPAYLQSDFYRGWAKPLGIVDTMCATLDKTGSGIATLTCTRHEGDGYVNEAALRRMRLLVPHFRRAVLISKALDLRSVQTAAFSDAIDAVAASVFLVTPQGELAHANALGQAMLDTGDPIKLQSGVLIASDAGVQASLQRAFADSLHGDAAMEANGMALPLVDQTGRRYIAHVLPLSSGVRRKAGMYHSAVAALFVREAKVDLPAAINAAAQLYGLTPAEERVIRGVIELGSIPPVAALLGTAPSTVKKHLEHVFEKTGTKRQADLVKLIAGFDSPARGLKTWG